MSVRLTPFTVTANVRSEGAIGQFISRVFELLMPDHGSDARMQREAIFSLRKLGFETCGINSIKRKEA